MPVTLTDENIVKTLYEWWSINYTDAPIDFKRGDNFDERNQTAFVEFMINDIVDSVVRESEVRRVDLSITVKCYGRSTSNLFAALGTASAVSVLLRQAHIPCRDYADEGVAFADRDVVGHIRLYEPKFVDEGDVDESTGLDVRVVTVEGYAEQTT